MYSRERANIVKNDMQFIPAGIQENIMLKSARTEKSINGNQFLEIKFERNGAILTHTEWEPRLTNFCTTQEELQEKSDNQYSRMLQILSCFYSDSELNFNGDTFKEFAEWVVKMLNNADKTKKVRAKVVYNDRNYTTLPKYAKFTFIEPMTIDSESSNIAELSMDKFKKSVIADNESNIKDSLQTEIEEVSFDSDEPNGTLPF